MYRERTPFAYVDDVKAPLMILAGANDYRCPIEPMRKYVRVLKQRDHPLEYIEWGSEGHVSAFTAMKSMAKLVFNVLRFLSKFRRGKLKTGR